MMRKVLAVGVVVGVVVLLSACGALANEQNALANRFEAEASLKRAEAERVRAEGLAEADRVRAKAEAEAELERAEASRMQTEAEAHQRRLEAETAAASERARVRQTERDASMERSLVMLPVLALCLGVVVVGVLGVVVLSRRGAAVAVDPGVILLLQRQQRQLDALERANYRVIAESQRRRLPVSDYQVVIHDVDNDRSGHRGLTH